MCKSDYGLIEEYDKQLFKTNVCHNDNIMAIQTVCLNSNIIQYNEVNGCQHMNCFGNKCDMYKNTN